MKEDDMMSLNYRKVTFSFGTALELHCIEPWTDKISGDYEIIGFTTIRELLLMGIDFYGDYIADVNTDNRDSVEAYYNELFETEAPLYIMKKVDRDPYYLKDTNEKNDVVSEYIYIADTMIDKNATIILVRRITVDANIRVGIFNDVDFNKEKKGKLLNELGAVLDTYSDKHNVRDTFINDVINTSLVLRPKADAEEEDRDFLEKQEAERLRKEAEAEAERKRLEAIALRERQLAEIQETLIKKRAQLNSLVEQAELRLEEISKDEEQIRRTEQALLLRELAIAEKNAALNRRAQRIYDRETELGIPHTEV